MAEQIEVFPVWEHSTRANPQVLYEQMRSEDPVYRSVQPWSNNPAWFLTRYEDCMNMLKDSRFGKQVRQHLPEDIALERFGPPPSGDEIWMAINRHMLNVDPPDHTRLRTLVHKAFTPRMVNNMKPRIEQIANELLDHMADDNEADLIADFAFPLPITVIAEMLGVPASDQDDFRRWTRAIVFEGGEQHDRAIMEFVAYMGNMIDRYHDHPEDNILSALVQAEEAGDRMDRVELLSMIFLLLVAGHETTVNLIGNGTLALMLHPDQMQKLQDDPGLINSAIEEMLRYNGPVETSTWRYAFEPVELHGKTIAPGDAIYATLLGANRDPAVFDDPNTFDITRTPNKHIAFGHGIHYCVGAPLARLEGTIAVNALLNRFPALRLNAGVDDLVWNDDILLHGMKALPVRY